MAARLIIENDPGTPPPIPNRGDDLESFWHVLLWVTLRHCEHNLPFNGIVASLRDLFDNAYIGGTGQRNGGRYKLELLNSQKLFVAMKLGNRLLHQIFVATATILAARYPESDEKEAQLIKVEKIWKMVQSENAHLQEPSELNKAMKYRILETDDTLERVRYVWDDRRTLRDVQWMEKIFEQALNDPMADWDTGADNIDRALPRNASQARKRKRESEINNGDYSKKQQKLSDLEPFAE